VVRFLAAAEDFSELQSVQISPGGSPNPQIIGHRHHFHPGKADDAVD